MKKSLFFASWLALTGGATLWAQEVSFRMELRYDTVGREEAFEVKYQVEGAEVLQFQPPTYEGFQVVGGPMSSTMMTVTNGQMRRSASYSYWLKPSAGLGTFSLPEATVRTREGELRCESRTVVVVEEVARGKQPADPLGQDNVLRFQHPFGQDFHQFQFPSFPSMPDLNFPRMPSMEEMMREMDQMMQQQFPRLQPPAPRQKQEKTYKL